MPTQTPITIKITPTTKNLDKISGEAIINIKRHSPLVFVNLKSHFCVFLKATNKQGWEIALRSFAQICHLKERPWAIYSCPSLPKSYVSDSLLIWANLSQKMSDSLNKIRIHCIFFTVFPLLCESLSSLFTKEQPWVNHFCHSLQKKDHERFAHVALLKRANRSFFKANGTCSSQVPQYAELFGLRWVRWATLSAVPHWAETALRLDSAEWGLDLPRTRCSGQSHSLMLYLSGQPPPRPQASASTVYNQLKYK